MPLLTPMLTKATGIGAALVAVATIIGLRIVPAGGCGTVLSLLTGLWAWGVVSLLGSSGMADRQTGMVLAIAVLINLLVYGIPLLVIAVFTRRLPQAVGVLTSGIWATFHSGLLLWIWKAADCP